ncbi:MAG: SIS domain-containing protein [Candidatus Aminicenantes bacterium]|nr:SIS domain-containing protein [Candidatus Aminicenantes bacterium]
MDHKAVVREWGRILEAFFASRSGAYGRAAEACLRALGAGRKILVFGNGGSAAEAQHFAAELVNKFLKPRAPLRAVALTTDTSVLTSVGNDVSFAAVFRRQVEALGEPGDVALALTTSGRSPNVVEGLAAAREKGLVTIALTGDGGASVAPLADILLDVPSASTPRIQEIHLYLLHRLAEDIESKLSG